MTLSELLNYRNEYSARQNSIIIFMVSVIVLTSLFPYVAYPLTYVLGIVGAILMISFISVSYGLKISKCFNRYKTSSLASYKLASYMAGYMWLVLAFVMVATALTASVTVGPFSTELFLFILFMYCMYLESEIHISDQEVFPVKTKLKKG